VSGTGDIPSVTLFGCRVDRLPMEGVVIRCSEFLREDRPHYVVTADTSAIVIAQDDEPFRGIINDADLVTPDSIGVVWASKRAGSPVPERVPGVDTMERLCELAAKTGDPVYLLGAAPGVAEMAANALCQRFPGLKVSGARDGFFQPDDEPDIVRAIAESGARILFVALGIPKQEKFIARNLASTGVRLAMGVGGSFDCFAGIVKRAPTIVRNFQLEWLWRTLSNPKKWRKALTLPQFAFMVLFHHKDTEAQR
jgi:N-acetylglucosaminyldiphosphoundecaprenol N-acetyl-beta-D-mannosaminyltransferase